MSEASKGTFRQRYSELLDVLDYAEKTQASIQRIKANRIQSKIYLILVIVFLSSLGAVLVSTHHPVLILAFIALVIYFSINLFYEFLGKVRDLRAETNAMKKLIEMASSMKEDLILEPATNEEAAEFNRALLDLRLEKLLSSWEVELILKRVKN